ncbi:MAG TPA: hypothetical protein VGG19_14570 [Tepidisphaeraceae bacterium]
MKVAKKHIAYLTVIAIGGGWLAMDSLSGSPAGTSSASAAVISNKPAGNSAPVALAADMGDEPAIAERLAHLNQLHKLTDKPSSDGFALPAAFLPAIPAATPGSVSAAAAVKLFTTHHTLTSVMVAEHDSLALIDGKKFLRVGDRCDGFTLASVTKNSAEFTTSSGNKATLSFAARGTTTASIGDK